MPLAAVVVLLLLVHSVILPFCHSSIPSFSHSLILPFHHSPILSFCHSPIPDATPAHSQKSGPSRLPSCHNCVQANQTHAEPTAGVQDSAICGCGL